MSDSRPEDTRIAEILEAWYAASQAGEHLDLDELCSHDSGLRSRVERILEREAALVDAATVRGIRHGEPSRLERLGEFQILSQIGAGGMSHVFLARQ